MLDENILLCATHSDHDDTVIHDDGSNTKKRYGKLFSQETYRWVLKELNISFKSFISDKCEDSTYYVNQIENLIDKDEIEELKIKLGQHKIKVFQANTRTKRMPI